MNILDRDHNEGKQWLQQNLKTFPVIVTRSILDNDWSLYTQKNIQKRSARFVFNNYSPYDSASDMLTNLSWGTFADR